MKAQHKNKDLRGHAPYDLALKDCIQSGLQPLVKQFFGIDLREPKIINPILHIPKRKEPDFLVEYQDENGAKQILHLDIQTQIDAKMLKRMCGYFAVIFEKYDILPYQVVLYLGIRPWNKPAFVESKQNRYEYRIIEIRELNAQDFLNLNTPASTVLAILGKNNDPDKLTTEIVERLLSFKLSPIDLEKYLHDLFICSELRNLAPTVNHKINTMPITLEKTKTFLYQEGLMEGKMEAIENNIEKLFCKGMKPEAIAYNLELDISFVYATLTKKGYALS